MRPLLGCILIASAVAQAAAGADQPGKFAVARKIYVAKCAKCHQFYEPTHYSEPDWQRWMEKMARKSKLKPEQAGVLGRYLDAYRAGQLPGKPETKR